MNNIFQQYPLLKKKKVMLQIVNLNFQIKKKNIKDKYFFKNKDNLFLLSKDNKLKIKNILIKKNNNFEIINNKKEENKNNEENIKIKNMTKQKR